MPEQKVDFTAMEDGTRDEYLLLEEYEKAFMAATPDRLLAQLDLLKDSIDGYRVSRYEHSLQSATRAYRDGAEEEMIVAALFHDIGDIVSPSNHSEVAAAILKPYVSERVTWIVKMHGLFQMYYYGHHFGQDRNARDRHKTHPWYADCVHFCQAYDQASFDPDYDTLPIAFFEPMVRRVFATSKFHNLDTAPNAAAQNEAARTDAA